MEIYGQIVSVCSVFASAVALNREPVAYIKALVKTTKLMLLQGFVPVGELIEPSLVVPSIGAAADYAIRIVIVPPLDAVGCEVLVERWEVMNRALEFIKHAIQDANMAGASYTCDKIAETCEMLDIQIGIFEELGVHGDLSLGNE
jgi:hypothetical protein